MNEMDTIQDWSLIDSFIEKSLKDFNKKLFGEYDDRTGYFEEIPNEEVDEQPLPERKQSMPENDVDNMSDEDMYGFMFPDDFSSTPYQRPQYSQRVDYGPIPVNYKPVDATNIKSSGEFGNKNIGEHGKKIYEEVSSLLGYTPVANSIYRSKALNDRLIAEGKPASKTSYHLTGNAVDFKPADWNKLSAEQKKYLKSKYDVIYHNNHYHVEPKQAGGVANTKVSQYIGLNDPSLEELYMPLKGTNAIRGLDSGEPVYVEDETGSNDVLVGPEDVIFMTGGVYEKRLPKKYKTKR